MEVTFNIPEDLAQRLIAAGNGPARAALEAIALEGYRSDALTEHEVCILLGLDSRLEVHDFLKEHGVYLHYGEEEIAQDAASSAAYQQELASEEISRHVR